MFAYQNFVLLLIAFNIQRSFSYKEVPSFLHICKRNDPNLKGCVQESVEFLRPYLKSGYPEHNIPSVEPIIIKELINEESNGIKLATSDVVAYGGSDYIVKDLNIDFDGQKYQVDILLPKLYVTAKYSLDGKIILLPIQGSGDFSANLTDCSAKAYFKSQYYNIGNEQHANFTEVTLKIKVGSGTVHLDNLFGGENIMSDIVNDAINKNFQMFLKEVLPYIERALAENFRNTGNKIVEPYTVDQLFPLN